MFYYLSSLIVIIGITGFLITVAVIRKQKDQKLDKGLNALTRKHPIVANPILIAYVLFPIVIIIGAAFLIYYGG